MGEPIQRRFWASPVARETLYSFQGGHSMMSLVDLGLLSYVSAVSLQRRWLRRTLIGFLAMLILTVGFSRLYLSVHWFSDVVGGFTLGAAWIALWIAIFECGRRRSVVAPRVGTPGVLTAGDPLVL